MTCHAPGTSVKTGVAEAVFETFSAALLGKVTVVWRGFDSNDRTGDFRRR
jgi:hypothetical protein